MRSTLPRQGTCSQPHRAEKGAGKAEVQSVDTLKDRKMEKLSTGKFTSIESAEFNNHTHFPALQSKDVIYAWRICFDICDLRLSWLPQSPKGKVVLHVRNKETAPGTDNTVALCWTSLLKDCPTNSLSSRVKFFFSKMRASL